MSTRTLRGVDRDTRAEILAAEKRGWTARWTGKGHIRLEHPSGAIVFSSGSSSDCRSVRALRSDLRRVEREAQS